MYRDCFTFTFTIWRWIVNATPALFTARKDTQYRLHKRLGGSQGWSEWVRKLSSPKGSDLRTIQPVANSYTDYAVPLDAYHITVFTYVARQTFSAECMNRFDAGDGCRPIA
jgi:hypothetical protein